MALSIEQFTAPGKFEIDLAIEELKRKNKCSDQLYIGLRKQPATMLFKDNPYYVFHRIQDK
jgi:hypothetical protein